MFAYTLIIVGFVILGNVARSQQHSIDIKVENETGTYHNVYDYAGKYEKVITEVTTDQPNDNKTTEDVAQEAPVEQTIDFERTVQENVVQEIIIEQPSDDKKNSEEFVQEASVVEQSSVYQTTIQEDFAKHNAVMKVYFYYFKSMIEVKENTVIIVMKKPSDEQVFASVYERYQAVWMNLSYRACSIYYTKVAKNTEISETCTSYAKYINWYNTKFSAKSYYDLNPVKNENYTKDNNNIQETVEKVDILLQESIQMNKVFKSSSQDNVLEKLQQTSIHLQSKSSLKLSKTVNGINKETTEKNCHDETWSTLLEYFGPKLIEIENYFRSVTIQQTSTKVTSVNELIPTLAESETFWQNVSTMQKEFSYNSENHDMRLVLNVSNMIVYWKKIKLETNNIEPPKNMPEKFSLVKETSGMIDYVISLSIQSFGDGQQN